MPLNQWRTVGVVVFGGLVLLAGAYVCVGKGPDAVSIFGHLVDGIEVLVVAAATKAGVQHLAASGGVKGVLSSLLAPAASTETKP